jgi:hypothetical protein
MSYQQTGEVPVLDTVQRDNIARTVETLFVSGELRPPSRRTKHPPQAAAPR